MVRTKKIRNILLGTAIASLFCGLSASAAIDSYTVTQEARTTTGDAKATFVVVEGKMSSDTNATGIVLSILNDNGDFDGVALSDIMYINQVDFPVDSKAFKFEFPVDESGIYSAKLASNDGDVEEFDLVCAANADYETVLAALASKLDSASAFKTFMNDANFNSEGIDVDFILAGKTADSSDDVLEVLRATLKDEDTDVDEITYEDFKVLWAKAELCVAVNDGSISADDFVDAAVANYDAKVDKWVNHADEWDQIDYVMDTVKAAAADDLYSFEKELKEALILAVTVKPDGNQNIGKVFKDFSDVTGITKSNETTKYAAIAKKAPFTSFNSLMNYYDDLEDPAPSGGSGSGSMYNGDLSGLISSTLPSNQGQPQVTMNFIDLDTVPWAYEAISTLADQGIINGRSDTIFDPDSSISREEFVKLCVALIGYDNKAYNQNFSDVSADAWYSKYVNIAYEAGICNGIGDGAFGVGSPVSRQDMVVILYNAMKIKGYVGDESSANFADQGAIASYAQAAVNALVNEGAVNGMGDNNFQPAGTATRAQAAKVIFGVLDILN